MKKNNHGVSEILYYNDTVNIIYEACTACYNNTKDISYQEKKEYIKPEIQVYEIEHQKLLLESRLGGEPEDGNEDSF